MKTFQPCIPCIMNLITSTLNSSGLDRAKHKELLERITKDLTNADFSLPPARHAGAAYHQILRESGSEDLFLNHKQASLEAAAKHYPKLKSLVEHAPDPLDAAIRVSALGNILDIANPDQYELDQEIDTLLNIDVAGNGLGIFKNKLAGADSLLLLADNAAETIFDKVLIETLELPVIYAVKSAPAFDDALIEDAQKAGIDQIAEIIESGTPYPGTFLPTCSPEFQRIFYSAPLILAKGQGNFETLNDTGRDLFFLLKVKCEVVSREIEYPLGSLTFKYKA